jgi:DNA-directed RNA polymerase subunit RPC12/RpoP
MFSRYTCARCGVVSDDKNHICRPEVIDDRSEICASEPKRDGRICESMAQHLSYECSACGRPADKPDLVCKPVSIR